ncbi:carbamoyltransferase HypF [Butyrivibrio sp. VCB2006]|uniref:carbamoyltransferase HypF n=1 Tax=Butyrivibrio sp. VCB2006 TaxID=1280679 RepID=UPI00041CB230|nr:carbamoyltransferase HypF [Butyrivibrio sp. VCB2006]
MISKITVKGAVQGVGYRPFILKKATEYGLQGFVRNIGAAVDILVKGDEETILKFTEMIKGEYPSGAFILNVEKCELSNEEYTKYLSSLNIQGDFEKFEIITSGEIDLPSELPVFLPDIGICPDCMSEMLDPKDRRYHYPLISCAGCGPRISILNMLPYDRDTTTMIDFEMCPECAAEYTLGRRRHAQTISCHDCGPQYILIDFTQKSYSQCNTKDITKIIRNDSTDNSLTIERAISLLRDNKIIGLKGSSGYQLVCKPNNNAASNLRHTKGREKKPFAVMFSNIKAIEEYCYVNDMEKELLESSARPIVLLNVKKAFDYEVCKDSRYIGAFLPSVGIHRLLCDAVGPLIVTSANKSDEPIIIDDDVFLTEFKGKGVDAVLVHKRKINMPQDDSVMFVAELKDGKYLSLFNRRARGYVPLPIFVKESKDNNNSVKVLAFGGDLKSTFSFGYKDKIIPSQYLGDLKDFGVNDNLKKLLASYEDIFKFKPESIVCDMHPLYESGRLAKEYSNKYNLPIFEVQHHHAHILSVMAEKSLKSCIGVSFDGTGYGTDGNIWGGEFLYCNGSEFERCGHMSYIKLCGGDNASRNAKLVKECYYNAAKNSKEVPGLVKAALDNNINVFNASSVGRLFDCVCALLGIKEENSFEGECAIALEKEAWNYLESHKEDASNGSYYKLSFEITKGDEGKYIPDQTALFTDICYALYEKNIPADELSYSFHMALSDVIVRVCEYIKENKKESKVCLSGGVFGNRLLLTNTYQKLLESGFEVFVNELVPAGDAGISVGQAYYLMLKED